MHNSQSVCDRVCMCVSNESNITGVNKNNDEIANGIFFTTFTFEK